MPEVIRDVAVSFFFQKAFILEHVIRVVNFAAHDVQSLTHLLKMIEEYKLFTVAVKEMLVPAYDNVKNPEFDIVVSANIFSGENLYIRADYTRAAEVLSNYLNEFSEGSFRLNAKFYLAESYVQLNKKEEALRLFKDISAEPNNQFLEQALMTTAGLFFENEDFDEAIEYYKKLEAAATNDVNRLNAFRGELLSASFTGNAQSTINAANKIINFSHVPEELLREAVFVRAKAYYSIDRLDEAIADFRRVAVEVISVEGAESKFRIAELLNRQNRADEAERTAHEFIDQKTPHQYWLARVFLLIAEISLKKGDVLQARATLQSLNDYYGIDNDGILDEVKAKLSVLNE